MAFAIPPSLNNRFDDLKTKYLFLFQYVAAEL